MIIVYGYSKYIGKTKTIEKFDRQWLLIYLFYCLIGIVRGVGQCFIFDNNYWIWKALISTVFILCVPFLIYLFSEPNIVRVVLVKWYKWAFWLFILSIPFFHGGAYTFVYNYYLLLMCFMALMPKRYKIFCAILFALMLFSDFTARSQVMRSGVVLLFAVGFVFHRFLASYFYRIIHWLFYVIPLTLVVLGVLGVFNFFEFIESNEGKYVVETQNRALGKTEDVDLAGDTRSFLYEEVIKSAVRNNYIWFGRSPARGNDSESFGTFSAEELKTGLYERQNNELCHSNIFTWLGLVGLIIYGLFYLRASWLAVYRSKSVVMKFLGCWVAFNWAFGWIENTTGFDTLNIFLWMTISMCMSIKFRKMSDQEMTLWVKSLVMPIIKRKVNKNAPIQSISTNN